MSEQGSGHQLGLQLPQKKDYHRHTKLLKIETSFTFTFLSTQKLIQFKFESSGYQRTNSRSAQIKLMQVSIHNRRFPTWIT